MTSDLALLTEQSYEPGSFHWVHVTHVNNPHSFYVRLTKHKAFLSNVETDVPTDKLNEVYIQQRILFKFCSGLTAKYIRGQIINIDDQGKEITCDILALDYGFLYKTISLKDIWKCKDSIVNIPPLAFECQLANCSPIGNCDWSDDAIEAIKHYFGDERAKMTIIDRLPEKLVVEMLNTCPDDIATLLALTGFSTFGWSHNMVSRVPAYTMETKTYQYRNLSVNETLHVRMQHGISVHEFYVIEVNDFVNYLDKRDMLTRKKKIEKEISVEELSKDFPVCVFDKTRKCERAIVKSIIPSTSEAILQLVDTGKEVKAHTVNMRHMPEEYMQIPTCGIYCSTTHDQLLNTRLYRFLHPGNQFLIKIKQLGHQLDSPNIVSITHLNKYQ